MGNWQKEGSRMRIGPQPKPAFNGTVTAVPASVAPASSRPVFLNPLVISAEGRKCRHGDIWGHQPWCWRLRAQGPGLPVFTLHSLPDGGPPLPCCRTNVAAEERGWRLDVSRAPAPALHLCIQPGLPHLFDEAFEVSLTSFVLAPHFPWNVLSSYLQATLSPWEAVRSSGFSGCPTSLGNFAEARVRGRQRTVECCHYCFREAGSFHPDNVGSLSKVLWNHSLGKSFCFVSAYLCNSSSHPPLSPLSQLPFAFAFAPYACVPLGSIPSRSLVLLWLTFPPALRVQGPLFLWFACFKVSNLPLIHFCTWA